MRWKKIGQVFNPLDYKLADDFIGYAQSPQVLVLEDVVRVYFSTRKRDSNGKFVSHIQFVEMSKDFRRVIRTSQKEIISLGNLGCFDEHGIFPFCPVRIENKIYAYTSGWSRRSSVSIDASIGIAVSEDEGLTFKRLGEGPVLTSSVFEPFLIIDGFVRKFSHHFYMFYIFGQKWSRQTEQHEPDRVYKIGYAISEDGIRWRKMNRKIIEDRIDENECQALPTVLRIGKRYHMFFCYRAIYGFRNEKGKGYRLGYAYSDDLLNWIRADESGFPTSQGDWDSEMMCYPHFVEVNEKHYLLYNGNEFGKYGFGVAELEGI